MTRHKKQRRKGGGGQSKHTSEFDASSTGIPEGTASTSTQRAQDDGAKEAEGRAGKGSTLSSIQGQTVNISGGTFTDVYIGNQTNIHNVVDDNYNGGKLFEKLHPVSAAHDCQEVASKVTECFEGTRQQLLHDIETWRTAESSVPILILDGIAGIGKTTVVKTACARAAAEHRLIASWFFSRDQQDRRSTRGFVGTLAYQLSRYHPALRDRIARALGDHPDILQKTIRDQFEILIHEPLQAVIHELGGTHAISIDAVDECNLEEAVEILSILLRTAPKHPQLRLLITCRPERPFRLLLQRHHGPRVFHLHEIDNSIVESDIRLYINHYLSPEQVYEALPDLLPPLWCASAKEKEALVQMAGKLFIVASTAVAFILDPRRLDPGRQIKRLLDTTKGSWLASSPMDRLYTQVLRGAVPDPVDDWFDDYQAIVGAIVVAADVLPVQALASLLGKEPNDIVRTLSHLHSLVAPTNHNEAFRVHHKSFPDFVTDPSRCSIDSRFLIDTSAHHFHCARGCLRVMVQMLKQNICDLPLSDWSKELSELPPGTVDRISPELAYACSHWIAHFQQGLSHFNGSDDAELVKHLKIFADGHLLSWLEVVALTGRFDMAWNSVDVLSKAIVCPNATGMIPQDLSHVGNVLKDFLRFISLHPNLVRLCPMHIYLSSLAFTPSASLMSKLYARYLPNESVEVVSGIDCNWDPVAVAFEGLWIQDLKISPCSTTVAILPAPVAADLELYDVKSGAQLQKFKCPHSRHSWSCFAFSPDGHLVATATFAGVYVWSVASGELIVEFPIPKRSSIPFGVVEPYEDKDEDGFSLMRPSWPTSIVFTDDGTSIVLGGQDGTVFLWLLEGDRLPQHILETIKRNEACSCPPDGFIDACQAHSVEDLIALPSPSPLISVTVSHLQFWDLSPPNLLNTIPRHVASSRTYACPISLSPNNTMVAIESNPWVISVYSTSQPCCIAVLSGHQGLITTTAFAAEPQELCSASDDRTVRIWNITTSTQLRMISTAPSILTDAIFAKSVQKFIFRKDNRLVMLTGNECTAFGPAVPGDSSANHVRLSLDASTIAICSQSFTIFSCLEDLGETPPSHFGYFLYQIGFFPTGELATICQSEAGFLNVAISGLKDSVQAFGSPSSFTISGIDPHAFFVTSPDMSRVAVAGESPSVSVYNLYSQALEALLEPLPDGSQEGQKVQSIRFSWDSHTVYVERSNPNDFHAAMLQPAVRRSPTYDKEAPVVAEFIKCDNSPNPDWNSRIVINVPPADQLHFLSGNRAWFLQHPNSWTHIYPPSLPTHIELMTYSPNGLTVALGSDDHASRVIQLRSLPDYDLVGSLECRRHSQLSPLDPIQFLPSLPHILLVRYRAGFTSWDTSTLEVVGDYHFTDPSITLQHIHPYNASDFLCLIRKTSMGSAVGLMAIQLRGDLPAKLCHICWFPPQRAIENWCLEVNPCHPHIIALKGRHKPLLLDISKFPLPFNL